MKFFVASLLFVVATVFSANYYIDFDGGSDAAAGTSEGAAWKHCRGDANATGVAASITPQAGDIFKFKGGVIYVGLVVCNWSGGFNNRIIYDGTGTTYGTGRAILDGNYAKGAYYGDEDSAAGFYIESKKNISIKGFEFTHYGGYPDGDPVLSQTCDNPVTSTDGTQGFGIAIVSGDSIKIDSCYGYEMGQWRAQAPFSGPLCVGGCLVSVRGGKNIELCRSEVTRCPTLVNLWATTDSIKNVSVHNNLLHNFIHWGINLSAQANSAVFSNIDVYNNSIYDWYEYDLPNWANSGGCSVDPPHTDGIFLQVAGKTGTIWQGIKIHGNKFWGDDVGLLTGIIGTASVFLSAGPSADIYNNVFNGTCRTVDIWVGYANNSGTKQVVNIFNNSFLLSSNPAVNISGEEHSDDIDVNIVNNIFEQRNNSGSAVAIFVNTTGVLPETMDYNIYYDNTLTENTDYVLKYLNASRYFSYITDTLGFEANGDWINPQYVDVTHSPLGGSVSSNNFHIVTGSPAKNTGTDLSSYFTIDMDGTARPQETIWDIGSDEYTSGLPTVRRNLTCKIR